MSFTKRILNGWTQLTADYDCGGYTWTNIRNATADGEAVSYTQHYLEHLRDATISSITADDILYWDGDSWSNISFDTYLASIIPGANTGDILHWGGSSWDSYAGIRAYDFLTHPIIAFYESTTLTGVIGALSGAFAIGSGSLMGGYNSYSSYTATTATLSGTNVTILANTGTLGLTGNAVNLTATGGFTFTGTALFNNNVTIDANLTLSADASGENRAITVQGWNGSTTKSATFGVNTSGYSYITADDLFDFLPGATTNIRCFYGCAAQRDFRIYYSTTDYFTFTQAAAASYISASQDLYLQTVDNRIYFQVNGAASNNIFAFGRNAKNGYFYLYDSSDKTFVINWDTTSLNLGTGSTKGIYLFTGTTGQPYFRQYGYDSNASATKYWQSRVLYDGSMAVAELSTTADAFYFQDDIYLNGNLILVDTVWDDLRVAAQNAKPGSSQPDWSIFQDGVRTYLFDAGIAQEVHFSVQMPHGWKEGTAIKPHIHWSPMSTNTGNVIWKLEYVKASIDGTFGSSTTISVTDAGDGTAKKHQKAYFSDISMTGNTISTMLICRLYRDAANAGDTFTADAAFLEFDFHYEIDTIGSKTATAK